MNVQKCRHERTKDVLREIKHRLLAFGRGSHYKQLSTTKSKTTLSLYSMTRHFLHLTAGVKNQYNFSFLESGHEGNVTESSISP